MRTALIILLSVFWSYLNAQQNENRFRRFHFNTQVGFNSVSIDEVISKQFAKKLLQGSLVYFNDNLIIGGAPDNRSGKAPVLNLGFEYSLYPRFLIGVGMHGIPATNIVGYFINDTVINGSNQTIVYDRVEELVKGITIKAYIMYALKPYKANTGLGWQLALGGGLSTNLLSVKQSYFSNSYDSLNQTLEETPSIYNQKASSVGAFLVGRAEIHFTRSFSVLGDFNCLFDTGVEIDETQFNGNQAIQQIDAHQVSLQSYLVTVGIGLHF
ncbi:MAG: hypothetical protein JNK61_03115 [Bacteroidia bacterium]|nr:hypothetical protein [Bacteroidia bacterium]HQV00869.1 hypothetical protein [Bacteroidia bacterium]